MAATGTEGEMTSILDVAREFGPWIALAVFFIWWTYRFMSDMGKEKTRLDEWIRTTLMVVLEKNTEAFNKMTITLDALSEEVKLHDKRSIHDKEHEK